MLGQIITKKVNSEPKRMKDNQVKISNRELEILHLICEQYTTLEIAQKLYISPRTVDVHRNKLLNKLQCKNTVGLVVYAIQNGLIEIDSIKIKK
ncbi:MAG: LuxR C-terminal-related transcriptional regulator [Saprospiraceae bacterium]